MVKQKKQIFPYFHLKRQNSTAAFVFSNLYFYICKEHIYTDLGTYIHYSSILHLWKRKTRKAIAIKIKTENLQDANLKRIVVFSETFPQNK